MPVSQDRLLDAAAAGALVLTANKRLARHLVSSFDARMQSGGRQVWPSPQIISFDGWLLQCMNELGESWRLLGKTQALHLWERIIEANVRGSSLELLQIGKTAERAFDAHRLLSEYGVTTEGYPLTEDQQIFNQWREQYLNRCREQQWLDSSALAAHICTAVATGRLTLPGQIYLVGFDQLPPGAEQLQAVCRQANSRCEAWQLLGAPAADMLLYAARDEEHEVLQAARWARKLLENGATSIGVVVFNLERKRRLIERIFRDQIDPAASPGLQDEEANFSLSLGGPLLDQGVIFSACQLLATGRTLQLEQLAQLLRSPYLGGSLTEADSRARFDSRIRSFRQRQLSLDRLLNLASEDRTLPVLAGIFKQLWKILQDGDKRLPGAWAELFCLQLQQLGWPGDRSLSSREYQALSAWRDKLMPAMASLDTVSAPIGRSQALFLLRKMAAETDFQLESPTGPLQIIGQLESAGLEFEHLWVMGLTDQVLPALAQPNPFLPHALQKQHAMPHADAARELQFAEQVMARLQTAAPEVVFSYPAFEGDCPLSPSPLVPATAKAEEPLFAESQDMRTRQRSMALALERHDDFNGPPLVEELAKGGTGILKDQAHCPFRAFVHHRLKGRQLDSAEPGLDAMTRGDLVHLLLEAFWKRIREQQQLVLLDSAEQLVLLEELAGELLEEYFSRRSSPGEALLTLEKKRLCSLVNEWLDKVERQRQPFRVAETEQQHEEQIGELRIRTIIDRIDELPDGRRLVIDYKTGVGQKADDLLCQPLLEPQLPIYAMAEQGREAAGVAFGQVRRGSCRFIGVVSEKGLLGRVKELSAFAAADQRGLCDWSQLLEDWRTQLQGLAADFVNGRAEVRPFDPERSCRYCDLTGLCRIAEVDLAGRDE